MKIQPFVCYGSVTTVHGFRDLDLMEQIRKIRNMTEADYKPEFIDWAVRLFAEGRNSIELMHNYYWLWKRMMKFRHGDDIMFPEDRGE